VGSGYAGHISTSDGSTKQSTPWVSAAARSTSACGIAREVSLVVELSGSRTSGDHDVTAFFAVVKSDNAGV